MDDDLWYFRSFLKRQKGQGIGGYVYKEELINAEEAIERSCNMIHGDVVSLQTGKVIRKCLAPPIPIWLNSELTRSMVRASGQFPPMAGSPHPPKRKKR